MGICILEVRYGRNMIIISNSNVFVCIFGMKCCICRWNDFREVDFWV